MNPKLTKSQRIARFWSYVQKKGPKDCWIWQANVAGDYGQFWDGKKNIPAHVFSYRLFLDVNEIPNGLWVLHKCPEGHNKLCVNPNHLYLGNAKDNARDRMICGTAKGGGPKGELHPKAVLTEEEVREIRRLFDEDVETSYKRLGEKFGVSGCNIKAIVLRQTWKNIA